MGLTKDLGSIPRAITVSGSNNNVGISKETPNAKLDVNGNVIVTGSLNVTQGITGSLFGTTSNAVSASYAAFATSASYALNATNAESATSSSYALNATNATNAILATTASYSPNYLPLSGGGVVSGNVSFIGTASFAYTTQSIIEIGASTITLNTDNPAARFGGMVVIDSGSFGTDSTGSMLWDSQNNRWVYANPSGSSYNGGLLISGPRNNSGLGDEQGTLNNYITKGQGGDHITSSMIYEDNSGNVGINTASPSRTLHVLGQTGIGTVLKLEGASGTTTYLQLSYNGATNAQSGYIGYDASANMGFFTNDVEKMRITSGGNVGIGTGSDTPEGKLTVQGISAQPPTSGTTANSLLQLKGSLSNELNIGSNTVAGNYGSYIQASDNNLAAPYQLNLQPNGGNVLIGGYTDAGFRLDVNGTGRFSSSLLINSLKINTNTDRGRINIETSLPWGTKTNDLLNFTSYGFDGNINTEHNAGSIKWWSADQQVAAITAWRNLPASGDLFDLAFSTNPGGNNMTERMRITSGGNVGIGTTSPLGSINNNGIQIDRGGHTTLLIGDGVNDGGVLQSSDNTRRMFMGANIYDDEINSWSQFVNASGFAAFDAIGGTTEALARILVGSPDDSGYGTGNIFFEAFKNNSTSYLKLRTNTDNALSITNSGNLLLRTTSDSGYQCTMNTTAGNLFYFTLGSGNVQMFMGNNSDFYISTNNSQGVKLPVGATSWSAYSDIRLKNVTSNIENALDSVDTLSAVKFTLKSDTTNKPRVGLIAQEVQEVLPEAVDVDDEGMLSVRYTELIPLLVASIQELKAEIEILKQNK